MSTSIDLYIQELEREIIILRDRITKLKQEAEKKKVTLKPNTKFAHTIRKGDKIMIKGRPCIITTIQHSF